jgi:urocanate hydratase
MGGAQPLAVTMNEGVCLVAEVDRHRIQRRLDTRYLDRAADDLESGVAAALEARERRQAVSIAVEANAVDLLEHLLATGVTPEVLTDQTSAHDDLHGYVPHGLPYDEALALRRVDPRAYVERTHASMAAHVRAMLALMQRGALTFDYGNNLRGQAKEAGVADAFAFAGFVPLFIRPLFCTGQGPFRWAVLSGDPEDLRATDEAILELFPEDRKLERWIRLAQERVAFQGLPARICWLGYGDRARAGRAFNDLVASGRVSAPIVIGRDHLDCGSVASPNRETEGMRDGSDAIGDWPVLNALVNAVNGASWISVHHGGGVGIGYSLHAGMVIVADGSPAAAVRLQRVLTSDPGMGVARHADAGYEEAIRCGHRHGLDLPMVR